LVRDVVVRVHPRFGCGGWRAHLRDGDHEIADVRPGAPVAAPVGSLGDAGIEQPKSSSGSQP
jgi:hypothetical protein